MPHMTIKNAITAFEAFTALIVADKAKPYDFKMAVRLKIAENVRLLRPSVQEYISKKDALVKELGQESQDKQQITVKPENLARFREENEDMLSLEIPVVLLPLKEKELGENDISPVILADLLEVGLITLTERKND